MRFNEVVDAAGICLHDGTGFFVKLCHFLLGDTAEAEDADEAVGVECQATEEFCELTVAGAAVEFHLPEAVLGMDEAEGGEEVLVAGGVDVGDAPFVTQDLHVVLQFWQAQGAGGLRQGAAQGNESAKPDQTYGCSKGKTECLPETRCFHTVQGFLLWLNGRHKLTQVVFAVHFISYCSDELSMLSIRDAAGRRHPLLTAVFVLQVSPGMSVGGCRPQQVSPAVGFACARQNMHARACQPILVGCLRFSTSSKNANTPRQRGV